MKEIVTLNSVTEAHRLLGLGKPVHPLISVFSHTPGILSDYSDVKLTSDLYSISLKDGAHGSFAYGRNKYDFEEGSLVFIAPNQMVIPPNLDSGEIHGWSILFHPDLIRGSALESRIGEYTFFDYDVHEALHLSEKEKINLAELVINIRQEIGQNMDRHTQSVIVGNIDLLLQYCARYYDRQFYTRTNLNKGTVTRFNHVLNAYFKSQEQLQNGIPSVKHCAGKLTLSPNYLSDLLKKETGRNTQEHIHRYIIERAKTNLLASNDSVSQIAFNLGFDYSQHFSKLFKSKTGMSPKEYRNMH